MLRVNTHYHMLKVWIWNNKCKVDRFEVIFRSFVSDSAIPAVWNNIVRKLTNPANPCLPKGSLAAAGSWLRRKAYGVKTNRYFRTSWNAKFTSPWKYCFAEEMMCLRVLVWALLSWNYTFIHYWNTNYRYISAFFKAML